MILPSTVAMRRLATALAALLLGSLPAAGQGAGPAFIEVGLGIGTPGEGLGPAVYLAGVGGSWKVRWAATTEIGLDIFGDSEEEDRWDVGLLRARRWASGRGFVSLAAGLAVTGGTDLERVADGDDADFLTVGIPVEASVGPSVGAFAIGLTLFGNLNPESPFAGLLLSLLVGRLPDG